MAARSGRDLLIKKDGTAIAGMQSVSVNFTANGVDITDKMDGGYVTYADFPGTISFEISGSGVGKTTVLRDIFKAGGGFLLKDVTIAWDDSETWECDVFISAYNEDAEHDNAVEFSTTMLSSGEWSEVA